MSVSAQDGRRATPFAQLFSPERRTSLYYFVNFTSSGASVAYGGIWFALQGLDSKQIGIVNALPIFIMLGLNLLVGRIADRADDWRRVIVIGAIVGAAIPFGLFFVHGFWGILLVWTALTLPTAAISPVADAAALRMTKRNGSDFGTIRGWGTVGYMVANAVTGLLVWALSSAVFVPLYATLGLARALLALTLPRFRAPPHEPGSAPVLAVAAEATRLRHVLRPWFLLPLIGFSLVFSTHIILNSFAALLWKEQGISEAVIGPLFALGAFAEAATMFAWRRFGGRFSARSVLIVSAVASACRWAIMSFSPPIEVLFPLQLVQSLTFALGFLGSVHFITKWTGEDIAAEVQSFFVVLQQLMSVVALAGFGWLVSLVGVHAYLVASAVALVGGLCVWLSMRLQQPAS